MLLGQPSPPIVQMNGKLEVFTLLEGRGSVCDQEHVKPFDVLSQKGAHVSCAAEGARSDLFLACCHRASAREPPVSRDALALGAAACRLGCSIRWGPWKAPGPSTSSCASLSRNACGASSAVTTTSPRNHCFLTSYLEDNFSTGALPCNCALWAARPREANQRRT